MSQNKHKITHFYLSGVFNDGTPFHPPARKVYIRELWGDLSGMDLTDYKQDSRGHYFIESMDIEFSMYWDQWTSILGLLNFHPRANKGIALSKTMDRNMIRMLRNRILHHINRYSDSIPLQRLRHICDYALKNNLTITWSTKTLETKNEHNSRKQYYLSKIRNQLR